MAPPSRSPAEASRSKRERVEPAANETATNEPGGFGWAVAKCLLAAVIVARLVTPTEGAVLGETIWIAQLALLALLAWAFGCYRERRLAFPLGKIDIAACLLVGGHVLSALTVVVGTGDKRSALTMLWEWVGVGATFFLIRQGAGSPRFRRDVLLLLMAAALPLAVVGLHQYSFGYAEVQREYGEVKARWDDLQRRLPQLTARDAAIEESKLGREFARMDAPVSEGARILWEQRIFQSREPFGMFALANTFAGLLGVALVLWIAWGSSCWQAGQRWLLFFAECAVFVIGSCLFLTKSRTGYVGLMGAVIAWIIVAARGTTWLKLWRRLTLLVVIGVGLALLWSVGAEKDIVDPFITLQAGKSLKYRSEYWAGTWRMLCESPRHLALGVGPGNFRSNYLKHKLPESSEEIADPHNLVLDVWANGGLVALAGLILVCWSGGGALMRPKDPPDPARLDSGPPVEKAENLRPGRPSPIQQKTGERRKESASGDVPSSAWMLAGGTLGCLAVFGSSGWQDDRLLFLLFGWLATVFVMTTLMRGDALPPVSLGVAFVFLAVHLLGAGGIGMPAISQLFLMLPALAVAGRERRNPPRLLNSQGGIVAVGVALLGIYVAGWTTGMGPVLNRRALVSTGDVALYDQNPNKAESSYRRAAETDRLSPEPYEKLGAIYHAQWLGARPEDKRRFDLAVESYEQAAARNPKSHANYRLLGELHLERFARTNDRNDAERAASFFSDAVARYPNHAELQAQTALALVRAGRAADAQTAAERALALQDLNTKSGHIDKYLSEKTLAELREIVR